MAAKAHWATGPARKGRDAHGATGGRYRHPPPLPIVALLIFFIEKRFDGVQRGGGGGIDWGHGSRGLWQGGGARWKEGEANGTPLDTTTALVRTNVSMTDAEFMEADDRAKSVALLADVYESYARAQWLLNKPKQKSAECEPEVDGMEMYESSGNESDIDEPDFRSEFTKAYGKYQKLAHKIEWKVRSFASSLTNSCLLQTLFPEQLAHLREGEHANLIDDLLEVDMELVMEKIHRKDPFRRRYGWLPQLWRCYAGGNAASSYCERMISVANDVMTHGRTLLDDDKLEMLAVLRMNREFMDYMRSEYPTLMNELIEEGMKEVKLLMADNATKRAATRRD